MDVYTYTSIHSMVVEYCLERFNAEVSFELFNRKKVAHFLMYSSNIFMQPRQEFTLLALSLSQILPNSQTCFVVVDRSTCSNDLFIILSNSN